MDETVYLMTTEDDEINRHISPEELLPMAFQTRRGSAPDAWAETARGSKPSPSQGHPGFRSPIGWLHKMGYGGRMTAKRGSDAGLDRVKALKAEKHPGADRPRSSSVDFGISQLTLSRPDRRPYNPSTPPTSLENILDVDNEAQGITDSSRTRWKGTQPPGTDIHTASATDTLSSIAARYRTTTSELTKINKLMSTLIFPGQVLYVPGENYSYLDYQTITSSPRPSISVIKDQESDGRRRSSTLSEIDDVKAHSLNAKKKSKSKSPLGRLQFLDSTSKRRLSDADRLAANSSDIFDLIPTFSSKVRYITNTADRSLVSGTLTFGIGDMLFEPDDKEVSPNSIVDDVSRYQLRLAKNLITAHIYNALPSRGKEPEIYHSKLSSNGGEAQKRRTETSKAQSKSKINNTHEKSVLNSLLIPIAIAIPDTSTNPSVSSESEDALSHITSLSDIAGDNKYLCIKLGISTDIFDERPAIGSLIKSVLPVPNHIEFWVEHYFIIPNERVDELDSVLTSWLFPDAGNEQDEKRDVVAADLGSRQEKDKKSSRKPYRRTLSAAELYNIPLPELSHPSTFITESHIRTLREHLPPRADGRPWLLVYSSERDGFSLGTLYRRMDGFSCPVLLACQDSNNNIFGAMSLCPFKIEEGFYGSGEMYIFTFQPVFKKYAWAGSNMYFIRGNSDSLSFGAGDGAFGLWLDDDLYRGRTQHCVTFDNDPLTDGNSEDFTVRCVEVWAFP